MVPCSSLNCSAIFPGTYPEALNAGWKPDGQRNLCPACATNNAGIRSGVLSGEIPRTNMTELLILLESRDKRIAELEQQNAWLQKRIDNYHDGPDD